MIDDNPRLWSLIASAAGAVTSLSFQQWEGMSWQKVTLALFVATSFGFFVSPLLLTHISDHGIAGAVIWLLAAGSNILIPKAVKLLSGAMDRMFGANTETN